MRFEFLAAGVIAGGVAIGASLPYMASIPNLLPTMPAALTASRDNAQASSKFELSWQDLNPLRLIFDFVKDDVQNNRYKLDLPASPAYPKIDYSFAQQMERNQAQFQSQFSSQQIGQWNAERIQQQIQDNNQRVYDMTHGVPPY